MVSGTMCRGFESLQVCGGKPVFMRVFHFFYALKRHVCLFSAENWSKWIHKRIINDSELHETMLQYKYDEKVGTTSKRQQENVYEAELYRFWQIM